MDVTDRFSSRVENYIKYRPSYPAPAVDFIVAGASLLPGGVVADVGCGTGISSRLFLERGFGVVGVEPNAPMREAATRLLAGWSTFRGVDGRAEQTTLASNSVDLVLCAQAFHWFSAAAARAEFSRILRAPGHLALMWNDRLTHTTPFLRAYEHTLTTLAVDYNEVNHQLLTDEDLAPLFSGHGWERFTTPNVQVFDWQGLWGRVMSSSYAPAEGHPGYERFAAALREVFERYNDGGQVRFEYITRVHLGRIAR